MEGSPIPELTMTAKAWDILSFFAYETVAQIVDLAFIVRRDNEAGQIIDAVERNAVPRVLSLSAELNKVRYNFFRKKKCNIRCFINSHIPYLTAKLVEFDGTPSGCRGDGGDAEVQLPPFLLHSI